MYAVSKPTNQQVRDHVNKARAEHVPLDPERLRRELGWGLVIPSSDPEAKKINDQDR